MKFPGCWLYLNKAIAEEIITNQALKSKGENEKEMANNYNLAHT